MLKYFLEMMCSPTKMPALPRDPRFKPRPQTVPPMALFTCSIATGCSKQRLWTHVTVPAQQQVRSKHYTQSAAPSVYNERIQYSRHFKDPYLLVGNFSLTSDRVADCTHMWFSGPSNLTRYWLEALPLLPKVDTHRGPCHAVDKARAVTGY